MKEYQILEDIEGSKEVKKLNKIKDDLYEITFCDGDKIIASEELVLKYRLVSGKMINSDDFNNLSLEELSFKAYTKAVNYIGSSYKTKKQIEDNLVKNKYPKYAIDYAINRLIENNIINDLEYAHIYVNYLINEGYGKIAIKHKLVEKGIDAKEILDDILDTSYYEALDRLAKKKIVYYKNDYNKLKKYLYQRGYSVEDILKVVKGDNNE